MCASATRRLSFVVVVMSCLPFCPPRRQRNNAK